MQLRSYRNGGIGMHSKREFGLHSSRFALGCVCLFFYELNFGVVDLFAGLFGNETGRPLVSPPREIDGGFSVGVVHHTRSIRVCHLDFREISQW